MSNDEANEWVWPHRPFTRRPRYGSGGVKVSRNELGGNLRLQPGDCPPAGKTVWCYVPIAGMHSSNGGPMGSTQEYYRPTNDDLDLVRRLWSDIADPGDPPWPRVETELTVAGTNHRELAQANALTLLMMLAKYRAGRAPATAQAVQEAPAGQAPSAGEPPPNRPRHIEGRPQWQTVAEVEEQVKKLAPTDCSILLVGETGTGKEYYAKKIRNTSKRKDRPFVVVNCATLTKERIDAELFGYAKGAYTGATQAHPGKIRQTEGGTVFLDELGALPEECWGNLMRFLQAKEIAPLQEKTVPVNVRILAATNKPDRIPKDALHRFNHVLHLPPLREHKGDIPSLAKAFFDSAAEAAKRTSLRFQQVEQEKLSQADYDWPGNIRQLEMAIQRAISLHGPGRELTAQEVLDAAKAAEDLT